MVPKSSDGDARHGSPSEHQPTEAMQTSTDDVTSFVLGKREDSGESEDDLESVDNDEMTEEEEEEDSDSNWDKDSFDGVEYNSSDYDEDYMDNKELDRMSRCYHRTVIESKGFFQRTDYFPPCIWGGFGTVDDLDDELWDKTTVRELLINLATECVEKHNRKQKKNVRFHQFLRANRKGGSMVKYYITFLATESDSRDDPLIQYQAKVGRYACKNYPILCRPSSP